MAASPPPSPSSTPSAATSTPSTFTPSPPSSPPMPAIPITAMLSRCSTKCSKITRVGSLMSCVTCTYSYHLKCALPPSRATPGDGWSCPECVSPLNEIDKILDCEMRPTKPGTQPKFDKQYLLKWNGLSYLHCTWVPEKDFLKASKNITRLKTRLNNFYKQMDSMNNSEGEAVAI